MFDKALSRGEIGCQFPDWYGIGNSVRVQLRLVVYVGSKRARDSLHTCKTDGALRPRMAR